MTQEIIEGFRLSPLQKRLWQLRQDDTPSPYSVQVMVDIAGEVQPDHLKAALTDVVEINEILRTSFQRPAGVSLPVQVIAQEMTPHLQLFEITSDQSVTQAEIEAQVQALHEQPFDLEHGPMVRASLVKVATGQQQLTLTLPAVCADTATMTNLVDQLATAYSMRVQGQVLKVDEEAMQYADLAEWQFEMLEGKDAEAGLAYWRDQNFSAYLDVRLPLRDTGTHTTSSDFNPQSLSQVVEARLAKNIIALAEAQDIPVSLLFLACWQVLLARLSDQQDIVVGTLCDGRTYEELAEAIGPLAKYLPLQARVESGIPFSQLLGQTLEMVSEGFEWQEFFSWDLLLGDEAGSFCPLGFDFEEAATFEIGPGTGMIVALGGAIDRFALKLSGFQIADDLRTTFHYDANLYDEATINRLCAQFHKLLESVCEDMARPLGSLDILPAEQRQQVLVTFNDTQTNYPVDLSIHHLIERQAEQSPNNVAVIFEDEHMTYAELNAQANQLAHYLQKLGVGPDTYVGIHLERSPQMIVGLVGILKAGGAYVPLDPEYPPERLALILEDTAAPVLLTQTTLLTKVQSFQGQVVCLDRDWPEIATQAATNPAANLTPENVAYVIFTSGSTGKPKGVPVSHRNLVHSTTARGHTYQDPVQRFLLLSSYSFDSSVVGLFWTLCTGGTLVLPLEGLQRDPQQLAALIEEQQITHLLALPSLWAYILMQTELYDLNSLATVIVAGEACPRALVERHVTLLPNTALYNEYGPTEGTVWCSVYDCRTADTVATVSIGRPIANMQIYILDPYMQPVPPGATGELYIGGVGLTSGYLNRPELTAEKFVANPFSPEPAARLYKTGDLGRYRSDGNIEFLGRTDYQLKIRGYRVELGEIEETVRQHPTVRDAVIVARERDVAATQLDDFVIDPNDTAALVASLMELDEAEANELLGHIEG